MRHPRRLLVLTALAMSCLVIAAVAVTLVRSRGAGDSAHARLAAVLVPGSARSALVVVDLDAARVLRRIPLRSLVTDIDVDPTRGSVVAAQTGGIGTAADNAASFTDVRAGQVRYVTLPRIDPSQVRCVGDRAVVLHSVIETAGYVLTSLDLATQRVVAAGHAPDGPGLWAAASGMLWTSVPATGSARFDLMPIDPVSLAPSAPVALGFAPMGVTGAGDGVAVLGGRADGAGAVTLLDGRSAAILATATVPGLAHGAQAAALVGDVLVVGDWNGSLPESNTLAVLDAATLALRRTISVGTAPCAIASIDGDLLVVDRIEGVMRAVDVTNGAVRWSVDLGARDMVCSRVVVIPQRTGGSARETPANRVAAR